MATVPASSRSDPRPDRILFAITLAVACSAQSRSQSTVHEGKALRGHTREVVSVSLSILLRIQNIPESLACGRQLRPNQLVTDSQYQ